MNMKPMKNIICELYNKNNGVIEKYRGPVYTKLDGMFGYLCVDGFKVFFFWYNGSNVSCDELDYFKVRYTSDI